MGTLLNEFVQKRITSVYVRLCVLGEGGGGGGGDGAKVVNFFYLPFYI